MKILRAILLLLLVWEGSDVTAMEWYTMKLPPDEISLDLGQVLKVSFQPQKERFRLDEIVSFYLEITNKTNDKLKIQFLSEEMAGSPLNRLHYFEVYKEGRKTWIYRQPHWSEGIISEGMSRIQRVLELDCGDTYREEFSWDPKTLEMNWLQRLLFRESGIYRIEIDMKFHPKYRASTPSWEELRRVELHFVRTNE